MPDPYAILADHLDALIEELQRLDLWTSEQPTAEALASNAPFCFDTLVFEQWLQWIFIPQMRQLIALQAPLPGHCEIAPMAELAFEKVAWDSSRLITLLQDIDSTVNAAGGMPQ